MVFVPTQAVLTNAIVVLDSLETTAHRNSTNVFPLLARTMGLVPI